MIPRDPRTGHFIARDRANFADGFVNMLTGAGTTTDPRSFNRYHFRALSDPEIDQAYRGGWVMRRIIDKPAREMVREWRNWQATPDDVAAMEMAERRLCVPQLVEKALQLAGLGGAGMVLYVEGDQSQPLDPQMVSKGSLRSVQVEHRSCFRLGPMIAQWGDPWHGHPEYFEILLQGTGSATPMRFHPSRVVAFKGHPITGFAASDWESRFWGDSTVAVVLDAVQNVDASQNGFASLIKDARNRRLSIPGLTERMATQESETNLSKRVQALALGENMFGVTFLDGGDAEGKGGEKLEDRQMVWAGIPQIADMYMTAAAGAADMPATVLWGKSPDGMNSTGESDLEIWERTIKGRQDLDLRPRMDRLDAVLIPSTTGKRAGEGGIGWEWRPLSVMSEPEAAKAFYDFMQGFKLLVDSNTMPTLAIEKMIQNKAAEAAWFPGTEAILAELPEDERFMSLSSPDGSGPSPA